MSEFRDAIIETLNAERQSWIGQPMVWGQTDCTMAIFNIYRQVFKLDLAADWRGRYVNQRQARRILKPGGLPAALRLVARRCGWAPVAPEDAQPGDLGLIKTRDGPACVIRHKQHWIHRIDHGFAVLANQAVSVAWSVEG